MSAQAWIRLRPWGGFCILGHSMASFCTSAVFWKQSTTPLTKIHPGSWKNTELLKNQFHPNSNTPPNTQLPTPPIPPCGFPSQDPTPHSEDPVDGASAWPSGRAAPADAGGRAGAGAGEEPEATGSLRRAGRGRGREVSTECPRFWFGREFSSPTN